MDLELTCWPDSVRTGWADPRRPPEVLEVGLALYDLRAGEPVATFSTVVRPALNPVLSDYCRTLLTITQADVDAAPPLPRVVQDIVSWERAAGVNGAPTCTWCTIDRAWLRDDAARSGAPDPFDGRPHVNVSSLLLASLGERSDHVPPRDAMTARLGLPPVANRHRALADALDLARFCARLATRG
jgi:inhibitor of KinA sporulation pathway (predicted exonuclease)